MIIPLRIFLEMSWINLKFLSTITTKNPAETFLTMAPKKHYLEAQWALETELFFTQQYLNKNPPHQKSKAQWENH